MEFNSDRRRWNRVPGGFEVFMDSGPTKEVLEAKDISAGGISLRGQSPLFPGQRAYLSFALPGAAGVAEVKVIGSVVWVDGMDGHFGCAVEYEAMTPESEKIITEYVDNMIFWRPENEATAG